MQETIYHVRTETRQSLGAVWSGSTLFAQTYLSENLGTLRYIIK